MSANEKMHLGARKGKAKVKKVLSFTCLGELLHDETRLKVPLQLILLGFWSFSILPYLPRDAS